MMIGHSAVTSGWLKEWPQMTWVCVCVYVKRVIVSVCQLLAYINWGILVSCEALSECNCAFMWWSPLSFTVTHSLTRGLISSLMSHLHSLSPKPRRDFVYVFNPWGTDSYKTLGNQRRHICCRSAQKHFISNTQVLLRKTRKLILLNPPSNIFRLQWNRKRVLC